MEIKSSIEMTPSCCAIPAAQRYTPRLKRREEVPTSDEVLGHFKERLISLDESEAIDEAKRCAETGEEKVILTALCGHGHLDLASYEKYLSGEEITNDEIRAALTKALLEFRQLDEDRIITPRLEQLAATEQDRPEHRC